MVVWLEELGTCFMELPRLVKHPEGTVAQDLPGGPEIQDDGSQGQNFKHHPKISLEMGYRKLRTQNLYVPLWM